MTRIKGGVRRVKHRSHILKRTTGFRWGRKNLIKLAKTAALKAGAYAYRDRRAKKGQFRSLWQMRINAAVREQGLSYSKFINLLKEQKIVLDRKILANLAMQDPAVFSKIVEKIKK